MNLADKRVQVMAGVMVAVFGFIVSFLTISVSFGLGFERTFTWAVIVGLIGWIVAEQVVRRRSPTIPSEPTQQSGGGGFSCLKCGWMQILAPPDSMHPIAKLEPCTYGDSKQMNWRCRECRSQNVIYWDAHHPYVGSVKVR